MAIFGYNFNMANVYVALGTNLGDRQANLQTALDRLGAVVTIRMVSPVYETEPWGVTDQPKFLNMAVVGETALEPDALLAALKRIEGDMGRTETVRYGPRVIDLDILFYDDRVVHNAQLEIPHPRLAERRFVLAPLADIAPDFKHPVLGLSVRELLGRLPDEGDVRRL